jgi:NAD-dependent deacetylase
MSGAFVIFVNVPIENESLKGKTPWLSQLKRIKIKNRDRFLECIMLCNLKKMTSLLLDTQHQAKVCARQIICNQYMKKLIALTGAGISAESGLATFRDSGGLWEGYRVEEVATPEAWRRNQDLVLEFYNHRRKAAISAKPNRGHEILAELQEHFEVTIITQNVDDLHERAGSRKVMHLHGNLFESRSTADSNLIYKIDGWELKKGDECEKGYQLRPNIVWFGEAVPLMAIAAQLVATADIFLIVGTSMVVYPAASLIDYVSDRAKKYVIDPKKPDISHVPNLKFITERASIGMARVKSLLMKIH